jgi:acetyltransferase-like isoleucine patch superfamily enzyme
MTMRTTLNRLRRRWLRRWIWQPVFGEEQHGRLLPNTRISSASVIEHEDKLTLGDNVFIGAFNFIEASGGITIEEGVQITSHNAIVTHSSHRSQRLLGPAFTSWPVGPGDERPGWISGPVHIGAYSFIGPHCLIEANTRIGAASTPTSRSWKAGRLAWWATAGTTTSARWCGFRSCGCCTRPGPRRPGPSTWTGRSEPGPASVACRAARRRRQPPPPEMGACAGAARRVVRGV